MREIKFRGYDVEAGKWVYGYFVRDHDQFAIFTPGGTKGTATITLVDPMSVGQSTCLADKDGVEVYEGDIVNWEDSDGMKRRNIVEFVNGGFVLCNNRYNLGHYSKKYVMGNVYENTDMDKGG
jgi:uncharacterized phage protein (TIGR01671 family)